MLRISLATLLVGAALIVRSPSLAQPTTPHGPELQANGYTTSVQSTAAAAIGADGGFVLTWQSYGQDGSYYGIFARRFDSAGLAQAGELQVNSYTSGHQTYPAIASTANGFVIAWSSSPYGIRARRFNASGSPLGGEIQVSTYPGGQSNPSVDANAAGDFVVAWDSYLQDGSSGGVFARRFNESGLAQATEFQVSLRTLNGQYAPSAAIDGDGDFVLAWRSLNQDGSGDGVFGRRFDSAGAAQGVEFQVSSYTTSTQTAPSAGMSAGGDFAVAWQSLNQDGDLDGIFVRRFDSTGAPQGAESQVNRFTTNHQRSPSLTMNASGEFVVLWHSNFQDGVAYGVFGQRFDSAGVPQSGEFRANTSTGSSESVPAASMNDAGHFVVAWQSFGQDGSNLGVFAQRFVRFVTQAAEFQVNAYTLGSQSYPAAANEDDGDFVVAWNDARPGDPFARRFAASTAALGGEFQIDAATANENGPPAVAMDGDGDFVAAWRRLGSPHLFGKRFDSAGAAQGAAFQVFTVLYQYGGVVSPAIDADTTGDFVVAWELDLSSFDGPNFKVDARRFSALGMPQGKLFNSIPATGRTWHWMRTATSSWSGNPCPRSRTTRKASPPAGSTPPVWRKAPRW